MAAEHISVSLAKTGATPANANASEITVKQFLDLLKTAYQVHDNLEGILISKGMTDVVDWIKLKGVDDVSKPKETLMIAPGADVDEPVHIEQADIQSAAANIDAMETQLQDHLSTVLNEGIMDSVLPLLVAPSTSNSATEANRAVRKTTITRSLSSDKLNIVRKKSISNVPVKTDSEVEIHVCDEVKGLKKDFICRQQLLVEQMGYFADVTKEQRLEDMDISVHCDINIFDWLMRWVKRAQCLPADTPTLEPTNAVPVLVSASFLQMEPLVGECLAYCHQNLNEIIKTSSSLSCLNDAILTRLAAMYTNAELETIKDRKDKIQSKLYCKLIQSLCEPDAETLRGHYCTLARLYRCRDCQQLINPVYGAQIPCIPHRMQLQFDGAVRSRHHRDEAWDINEYVASLYKLLKSWRKVYWRLWGACHFLYCNACKKYFPAKQDGWCRFHPDLPQFFTLDTQKPPLPVGRYPCCGERAYRFQILEERSGCQFREHTISTTDIKDAAIASLLEAMRGFVSEEPPKLVFPDRLTRLIAREPSDPDDSKLETKEVFWWEGLEIVPARPKMGMLNALESDRSDGEDEDGAFDAGGEEREMALREDESPEPRSDTSTTDSSAADSEESVVNLPNSKRSKKATKDGARNVRQWQLNLSSRSNQDMQRLNEEAAFKKMATLLNAQTKLTAEIDSTRATCKHAHKPGGIWVRLESEWKEKNMPAVHKTKNIYNGKVRMKTTRLI